MSDTPQGRTVRPEFEAMQDEAGCPECGSTETYQTFATVDQTDNVAGCLCDLCGHFEAQYEAQT
jgi:transcription elongation factor Elf1